MLMQSVTSSLSETAADRIKEQLAPLVGVGSFPQKEWKSDSLTYGPESFTPTDARLLQSHAPIRLLETPPIVIQSAAYSSRSSFQARASLLTT